jgi:ABC-2 type transport system permease protein
MAKTFSIDGIGLLLGGITIFIISLSNLAAPSLIMWLQFVAMFVVGMMVMLGISLIMAATSFKWVGNSRIPEIFDSLRSFGKYPQSIFPKTVLIISSFVIPVAMIGFFPAAALLGRGGYVMFYAILPCVLFMTLGILLYRSMVRLYQGVGG